MVNENKSRLKDLPVIIILTLCVICSMISYYNVSCELKELKGGVPTQDISMGLEIEKKWVIDKDKIPYDLSKADCFEIKQTYINYTPEIRVREIKNNGVVWYMMAIKRYVNDDALTREESDFYITKKEYESTVGKGLDNTIYKKRYQFEVDGLTYAVDIFEGGLAGIIYGCDGFNYISDDCGINDNRGIPFEWFMTIADKRDIRDLCYAFSNAVRQVDRDKYEDISKFWYSDEIYKVIDLLNEVKNIVDKKDKDYGSHIVSSESRLSSSLSEAINNAETIKSIGKESHYYGYVSGNYDGTELEIWVTDN